MGSACLAVTNLAVKGVSESSRHVPLRHNELAWGGSAAASGPAIGGELAKAAENLCKPLWTSSWAIQRSEICSTNQSGLFVISEILQYSKRSLLKRYR